MKLYSHPGYCSSASEICLREAGADFEHIKVDVSSDKKLPDGRYLYDVSPKGYIPILELDNGEIITENQAVLQYIADQFPDAGLAAANGTLARTRIQEWLSYLNGEVHKSFSALLHPALADEAKAVYRKHLDKRLRYIDEKLAAEDYLHGKQFSIADAYLFIILGWAPMAAYELSPFANLLAYRERLSERESIRQTLASMA